jgi:hypothetical protein
MKHIKVLRSHSGQVIAEAILLMVVFMSLTLYMTRYLRESQYLSNLIERPWAMLAGMIESGAWDEADKARLNHPNHLGRQLSFVGDTGRR